MPAIIMIGGKDPAAAKRKRPGMPPLLGMATKAAPPKVAEAEDADNLSERNNDQETPSAEKAEATPGAAPSPTPESVLYHDGSEVCGSCEYMDGANCSFLQMAVDEGGHCQRFEAKGEDGIAQHDAGGMEIEGPDAK